MRRSRKALLIPLLLAVPLFLVVLAVRSRGPMVRSQTRETDPSCPQQQVKRDHPEDPLRDSKEPTQDTPTESKDSAYVEVLVTDLAGQPLEGAEVLIFFDTAVEEGTAEVLTREAAFEYFRGVRTHSSEFPKGSISGKESTDRSGKSVQTVHWEVVRKREMTGAMLYIWASHPDFVKNVLGTRRLIRIPAEGERRSVTIQLEPARTVRGRIIGPDPKKPQGEDLHLSEAETTEIRPKRGDRPRWWASFSSREIKQDYTFELKQAPKAPIRVVIKDWSDRFKDAVVVVPENQDDIEIHMELNPDWRPRPTLILILPKGRTEHPSTFDGALHHEGSQPSTRQGKQLPDGSVVIRFDRMEPGPYEAIVTFPPDPQDRSVYEYWEELVVLPDSGMVELKVETKPGRELKLKVLTESGKPPAFEDEVSLFVGRIFPDGYKQSTSGANHFSQWWDSEGRYQGRILPRGRTFVQITSAKYKDWTAEVPAEASGGDFTVVLEPK